MRLHKHFVRISLWSIAHILSIRTTYVPGVLNVGEDLLSFVQREFPSKVPPSPGIETDLREIWSSIHRTFRISRKCIVLHASRRPPLGQGCSFTLFLPSGFPHSGQSERRRHISHLGSPLMARQGLDSRDHSLAI